MGWGLAQPSWLVRSLTYKEWMSCLWTLQPQQSKHRKSDTICIFTSASIALNYTCTRTLQVHKDHSSLCFWRVWTSTFFKAEDFYDRSTVLQGNFFVQSFKIEEVRPDSIFRSAACQERPKGKACIELQRDPYQFDWQLSKCALSPLSPPPPATFGEKPPPPPTQQPFVKTWDAHAAVSHGLLILFCFGPVIFESLETVDL